MNREKVQEGEVINVMAKDRLVLTQSQWDEILKWIPSNEQAEEDERVLRYLQEGSAALKAKWPENNKKEETKKVVKSSNPEIVRYEAIKNADSAKRQEMIEEAEKFVSSQKFKECPIELKSAAILSENLYSRKLQLEFQAAQKKEEKAKTLQRNKLDMAQSISWLQDGFAHRTNAFRIACEHKRGLADQITERKNQRDAEKASRIAEEQKINAQHDKDIVDRKVRDRKLREEQNEYMRKHEVETVLMAKQKREHIKRENEVIDVLAKVHNEGKNKIKELIKNQEDQSRVERIRFNEKLADMAVLRNAVDKEKLQLEQKMIENARIEKEKVLDSIEEKHKAKRLFLKNDRMQDYNQSIQTAAERLALKKEEDKEYFKNRIMNDVVSSEYTKMKRKMKEMRTCENIAFLKKQAREVRMQNKKERDDDIRAFNKKIQDDPSDQKFFDFAQDLLDDAQSKNRPLKPVFQIIKSYKNRHFIDIKKKTRPHEISNVPIGPLESQIVENDKGKSKRRLKYEKGEKLMENAYRSTKFLNID